MLGIICAMDKEAKNVVGEMTDVTVENCAGSVFTRGKLRGADAVVAVCGVGKVNAAACTQTMILRFAPDAVVNVGIAGALDPDLKVFDIVVATGLIQHDFDLTPLGAPAGLVPGPDLVEFPASRKLTGLLEESIGALGMNYRAGLIASGDQFIDTAAQRARIAGNFGAVACEMEGAAIAQVCCINGVDFAVLRAVSDTAEGDYEKFSVRAADISAKVVCKLAERF